MQPTPLPQQPSEPTGQTDPAGPGAPPPSPHPPRGGAGKRPIWLIPVVAGATLALVCCLGTVAVIATSDGDQDPAVTGPDQAAESTPAGTQDEADEPDQPEETPEPEPEPTGFGNGTWEVGDEIPPGTYVTDVSGGGALDSCYWARLAGFSGDLDDILANGNLNGGARGRVTIAESDAGVEFTGGCTWLDVADAGPAAPGEEIGEGVWAVGDEVESGTYTTDVSDGGALDSCYWARLSGFSGAFDHIVANGNVEAGSRGRVEIASSDAGIEFSGDCVWVRS